MRVSTTSPILRRTQGFVLKGWNLYRLLRAGGEVVQLVGLGGFLLAYKSYVTLHGCMKPQTIRYAPNNQQIFHLTLPPNIIASYEIAI
jgi:hypothetical protein